jgi:argininosuccinate lyase
VALSVQTNTPLDQLDLSRASEHYGADAKDVFNLQTALAARTNPGAPSVENVKAEVDRWQKSL